MTEPDEPTPSLQRYYRVLGAILMTAFVVAGCAAVVFLVIWLFLVIT